MTEENKKNLEVNDTPMEKENGENKVKEEVENSGVSEELKEEKKDKGKGDFKKKKFKKNFRKRRNFDNQKPEFEQKILSLRRVTRVMAGGRRFSFSVAVVIGDKKNRVGLGMGKSSDTTMAIDKAVRNAKKNMVKINLKDGVLPYDVSAKYKSSEVVIRPVTGKGLAAGGAVRIILELAGVKEAGAKILTRSKNHINNAKATLIALKPFSEKAELNSFEERKKKVGRTKRFSRKDFSAKKSDKGDIKKDNK